MFKSYKVGWPGHPELHLTLDPARHMTWRRQLWGLLPGQGGNGRTSIGPGGQFGQRRTGRRRDALLAGAISLLTGAAEESA